MIVITSTGLKIDTARRYDRATSVRQQAAEACGPRTQGPAHSRLARGESVVRSSLRASGGGRITVLSPR